MGAPPMNQQYQQPQQPQYNYQQQQWMMPPPPQQQAYQGWAQQPPPQQALTQSQQYLTGDGGSEEIKSLWIGGLQPWMDEEYLYNCFAHTGQAGTAKVIRNKMTCQPEGYGFIEFASHAAAEMILQTYNGTQMPNSDQTFRMNWATLGAGEKRMDNGPEYSLFVGDLAPEVTDYVLQETFRTHYQSVKGAKVVMDRMTNRSKGYGFVKFGDEAEQLRAMSEMNGMLCSSRPMRLGAAANKKPTGTQQYQKAGYPSAETNSGESDPSNTTIFVGGLDESVTDDYLRQVFGVFGELIHVKVPPGKRCGFVQFADRAKAEQALSNLNGTQLGGHTIRLSWGRGSGNKQGQTDQTQSGGSYYGNGQGYQGSGYAPPSQDPNMYYGAYSGYGNYQQPQQ